MRDDVEEDRALGIAAFGIDREGDADTAEQEFRFLVLAAEEIGREIVESASDRRIGRAACPGIMHSVEPG